MNYTQWIQAGNTSPHYERIRQALTNQPQTRNQLAAAANVSPGYAHTALQTLIELGEAQVAGTRPGNEHGGYWKPANLYTTT